MKIASGYGCAALIQSGLRNRVVPAEAGTHAAYCFAASTDWIPVFTGMTTGVMVPSGDRETVCRRARADAPCRSTRRAFILAAAAWPVIGWKDAVLAQTKQPVLIGWLSVRSPKSDDQYFAVFKEGLAALGWKEGSQFVIEERWADGRVDRLRVLAEELAAKKPAVIVAGPVLAVATAAKAAPKTPIVQYSGDDLVTAGLAKSLARPGGMITGVSNLGGEISEKYLELLRDSVPGLRRVGFLSDPSSLIRERHMETARRSAARYSMEARFAEAAQPEDIEPALLRLAKEGAQALVVMPSSFFGAERQRIVRFALAQRWPMIAGQSAYAAEGALLSYGADRLALSRRAAYYVDRILKGAKPGDLPIEQPMKIELVVNMKTAKALGIKIPQSILVRADKVIE